MPIGPASSERHVDQALTDISIAHQQSQADSLLYNVVPVIPVQRASDKYTVFPPATWNKRQARVRAPGDDYQAGGYTVSKTAYSCDLYSVAHKDPKESQFNADPVHDPEVENTQWVTGQLLMEADALIAAAIFTTGVWTTDLTGVTSGAVVGTSVLQWDQGGSDPITDAVIIKGLIKKQSQFDPNQGGIVGVIGYSAWTRLINHAAIIDRTKHVSRESVTTEMVASLFQIDKIVVPGLVSNTANPGQTATFDYIVDDLSAGFYFVPKSPGKRTLSAAYVFGVSGVDGFQDGTKIATGYHQPNNSDYVYGDLYIDIAVTAAGAGAFISGVVAS